ncbi:MAG: YggS family pyridoxal phosphate-dependent enzyme [Ignavibacteria bacterium]
MNYKYLKTNYENLLSNVNQICTETGRNFNDITIVAISKTFPVENIKMLYELGHIHFGENKVQELKEKYQNLTDTNIKWHLVGHLQTNKVKYIVPFITLIHSVDNIKLALEINKQAQKLNRTIDILVQVNTSDEPQKSGITPSETKSLCKEISKLEYLRLKGLMTIGMFTDNEAIIRDNFRTLANLYKDLETEFKDFRYLSMGMTSDYRIAIEEGANILRIGSAIFGERSYH